MCSTAICVLINALCHVSSNIGSYRIISPVFHLFISPSLVNLSLPVPHKHIPLYHLYKFASFSMSCRHNYTACSLLSRENPSNRKILIHFITFEHMKHDRNFRGSFPSGSDGKESHCNAGDLDLIRGLGRSPGKGNAICSSILAWKIPWTEEPGGLQSMGSQRVEHD